MKLKNSVIICENDILKNESTVYFLSIGYDREDGIYEIGKLPYIWSLGWSGNHNLLRIEKEDRTKSVYRFDFENISIAEGDKEDYEVFGNWVIG